MRPGGYFFIKEVDGALWGKCMCKEEIRVEILRKKKIEDEKLLKE